MTRTYHLLLGAAALLSVVSASSLDLPVDVHYHAFKCPAPGGDSLELTLTLPADAGEQRGNVDVDAGEQRGNVDVDGGGRGQLLPVVVFVNGFELRSCVYLQYARHLASKGYAVLQYDDTGSPLSDISSKFNDAARVEWISAALNCTATVQAAAGAGVADAAASGGGSPLPALLRRLDFSRLGVAGHSRGGKIAGLFFAEHAAGQANERLLQQQQPLPWQQPGLLPWRPRAAFLVDPIDTPVNASQKCMANLPSYDGPQGGTPNLAEMLRRAEESAARSGSPPLPPLAVLGTGRMSACNCRGSGYEEVWGSGEGGSNVPPGSWLMTLPQSGHLQVTDDSLSECGQDHWLNQLALRAVYADYRWVPGLGRLACAQGPQGSQTAVALAAHAMGEYFDLTLKGNPISPSFQAWVDQQVRDGNLTFKRKAEHGRGSQGDGAGRTTVAVAAARNHSAVGSVGSANGNGDGALLSSGSR